MTMPTERTRALRWAGEFLRSVRADPLISHERRREADVILRHYPDWREIEGEARVMVIHYLISPWLAPEQVDPWGASGNPDGNGDLHTEPELDGDKP